MHCADAHGQTCLDDPTYVCRLRFPSIQNAGHRPPTSCRPGRDISALSIPPAKQTKPFVLPRDVIESLDVGIRAFSRDDEIPVRVGFCIAGRVVMLGVVGVVVLVEGRPPRIRSVLEGAMGGVELVGEDAPLPPFPASVLSTSVLLVSVASTSTPSGGEAAGVDDIDVSASSTSDAAGGEGGVGSPRISGAAGLVVVGSDIAMAAVAVLPPPALIFSFAVVVKVEAPPPVASMVGTVLAVAATGMVMRASVGVSLLIQPEWTHVVVIRGWDDARRSATTMTSWTRGGGKDDIMVVWGVR